MDLEMERKKLVDRIERIQKRVNKVMKQQMGLLKKIYKVDDSLDKLIWDLSQKEDSELISQKELLERELELLFQKKYANNDILKKQDLSLKKCKEKLDLMSNKSDFI